MIEWLKEVGQYDEGVLKRCGDNAVSPVIKRILWGGKKEGLKIETEGFKGTENPNLLTADDVLTPTGIIKMFGEEGEVEGGGDY